MRRYGDHVVRLAYSYRDMKKPKMAQSYFCAPFLPLLNSGQTWSLYDISCYCESLPQAPEKCFGWFPQFSQIPWPAVLILKSRDFAEKALFDAVMELPVKYREVIVLFYLYQFDTEKIAEITGVKRSLVKVRLYRARQQLREILLKNRVISDE